MPALSLSKPQQTGGKGGERKQDIHCSILKGPADLLMLTHLKVTSFFHAFSAPNPACVCVCVHELVLLKYRVYSCVNILLLYAKAASPQHAQSQR